jgi:hypothetical protein
VNDDRQQHILAIETSRNKKIFDKKTEYLTTVIESQGAAEYELFIHQMKQDILGHQNVPSLEAQNATKESRHKALIKQIEYWRDIIKSIPSNHVSTLSKSQGQQWYLSIKNATRHIKCIIHTLQRVRQTEWNNAKNHLIRIGKYGPIARMTIPKPRSGPVAGSFFPTKPGEPIRRAFNDKERKEASTIAHSMWMDNPPGAQNCHSWRQRMMQLDPMECKSYLTKNLMQRQNGNTSKANYQIKLMKKLQIVSD